jgi:hypothetical protein
MHVLFYSQMACWVQAWRSLAGVVFSWFLHPELTPGIHIYNQQNSRLQLLKAVNHNFRILPGKTWNEVIAQDEVHRGYLMLRRTHRAKGGKTWNWYANITRVYRHEIMK